MMMQYPNCVVREDYKVQIVILTLIHVLYYYYYVILALV